MVQANKLMIGNYLYSELTKQNFIVSAVDIHNINEDNSTVTAIPLTPEILQKSGFKKSGKIIWISIYNLKAELQFEVYDNTDELVAVVKSDFCELILDRIKYLHQLQNLIFSLSATELQIKNL